MSADLLFKNATVVDGNGGAPYVADVAIKDGLISAIGSSLDVKGRRTVDATGKHLMPGWTDIHTHYDAQCMWDPLVAPSAANGVTTVVTGNCGVGVAPTRSDEASREFMIQMLGAIEDIPAETLREGVLWEVGAKAWESFPEYLDALDQLNFGVDIACLVPHSCVRPYVLGVDRASVCDLPGAPTESPLTFEEKTAVAECVRESIAAGAIGFSTNRLFAHRDTRGTLASGTLADAEELALIGKAVAEAGGTMFEIGNVSGIGGVDWFLYDDVQPDKMDREQAEKHNEMEWKWIHLLAKEYGLTVQWLGGVDTDRLEEFAANGEKIYNQQPVRPQAFIQSFESRMHPFNTSKKFQSIAESSTGDERVAKLHEARDEIIAEIGAQAEEDNQFGRMIKMQWFNERAWKMYFPMTPSWNYEPMPDESIAAIAEVSGKAPLEVCYDQMLLDGATGMIWRSLGGTMDVTAWYEDVKKRLECDRVVPALSDAGAHLAIFQDGTGPTSMLSFWGRDRVEGSGGFPIEYCVMKQARDPAHMFGLLDRGTIEVGKKADLNLVDTETLGINRPEYVHDFPADAPRWDQTVRGYVITCVNGVVTFEDGRHTGSLPGRLVRSPGAMAGNTRSDLPDYPAEFSTYRKDWLLGEGLSTAESVLERSLDGDGGGGISHQSRIAAQIEEEQKKRGGATAKGVAARSRLPKREGKL